MTLSIQRVPAPRIIGASVETAVLPAPENQVRAAAWTHQRPLGTLAFIGLRPGMVDVILLRSLVRPAHSIQPPGDGLDLSGRQAGRYATLKNRPAQFPTVDNGDGGVHILQLRATGKGDDRVVDRLRVLTHEIPNGPDMPRVLFNRIPKLVLVVVNGLGPVFRILSAVDPPFVMLGLYHENPEPRDDDVVDLAAVATVHN